MASVKPIPDGYPRVTPYLCVDEASAAIDFYKEVFGATERMRMGRPEGKVGHAELQLGDSLIMLADEQEFYGVRTGQLEDPFGHRWSIATRVEDLAPDEIARRAAEVMAG